MMLKSGCFHLESFRFYNLGGREKKEPDGC